MLQALIQSPRSRRSLGGFFVKVLEVMTGDEIGEVRAGGASAKVGYRYYVYCLVSRGPVYAQDAWETTYQIRME